MLLQLVLDLSPQRSTLQRVHETVRVRRATSSRAFGPVGHVVGSSIGNGFGFWNTCPTRVRSSTGSTDRSCTRAHRAAPSLQPERCPARRSCGSGSSSVDFPQPDGRRAPSNAPDSRLSRSRWPSPTRMRPRPGSVERTSRGAYHVIFLLRPERQAAAATLMRLTPATSTNAVPHTIIGDCFTACVAMM